MEDNSNLTESLFERVEDYGKTCFELLKLKAVNKTAGAVSTTVSYLLIILMLLLCLFTVSIGVALWLGELLGKTYYGFFWVAGFYGFLGVVFYLTRNIWIKKSVSDSVIAHALN